MSSTSGSSSTMRTFFTRFATTSFQIALQRIGVVRALGEHHPAVALDDLAELDRVVPLPTKDIEGAEDLVRVDHRDHPDPEVEDVRHLLVVDVAETLDLAEDRRDLPGVAPDQRVAVPWEHSGEIARNAAAGDVRSDVHADGTAERVQRRRVDEGRAQQLVGQRV